MKSSNIKEKLISLRWKVALTVFLVALIWTIGTENQHTPGGYVGYVTQNAVLGEARFVGLQQGPSSTGRRWMYRVQNISVTPFSYVEDFTDNDAPLSKDRLKIRFRLSVVWSINPERAQSFVEEYATPTGREGVGEMEMVAYHSYLKEKVRSFALDEIQKRESLQINSELVEMSNSIQEGIQRYASDTPFMIHTVNISNIQFPKNVADAVAFKLAARQELERMDTELAITKKKAAQREIEASGLAKAQAIIAKSLTPEYLQHEAIEAQKLMVNSPNNTIVYIPVGKMGVPMVRDIGKNTQ